MNLKSILFNTDMVRAILEGRKTVTRRLLKGYALEHLELDTDGSIIGVYDQFDGCVCHVMCYAPYHPGYILYVPQAWKCVGTFGELGYKVEFQDGQRVKFKFESRERAKKWAKYRDKPTHHWQSPYFMPREAARIFLRVTDVRVEMLQDITEAQAKAEGAILPLAAQNDPEYAEYIGGYYNAFADLWDSTIKTADRALYGFYANPWVWVIEFERCEKPDGWPALNT